MYERLLVEAAKHGIDVYEQPLQRRTKGLYSDGIIWINSSMLQVEKCCILAEEIGHHHTSVGCIIDQSDVRNRKQELRARQWSYFRLIPLTRIVEAHQARVKGRYELAEYFGVTEQFLQDAIDRYRDVYGLMKQVTSKHIVVFEPLGVIECFEE